MSGIRRNESYLKMKAYLDEQGYSFEPFWGSKHPYLLVNIGVGSPFKVFFPSSSGDHRVANNQLRTMKRLIHERRESQR